MLPSVSHCRIFFLVIFGGCFLPPAPEKIPTSRTPFVPNRLFPLLSQYVSAPHVFPSLDNRFARCSVDVSTNCVAGVTNVARAGKIFCVEPCLCSRKVKSTIALVQLCRGYLFSSRALAFESSCSSRLPRHHLCPTRIRQTFSRG